MSNIAKLRTNLEREGFQTSYFETAEEASAYLDQALDGTTIGFGGSQTVRDMGLYERLSSHNACVWHWDKEKNVIPQDATNAEVYICSLNGVSENGELINIDGGGNRVASGLFGHKKVYFIIGVNKIAPDYEQALWRARNTAGPLNARRLNRKTPCAQGEVRCHNCRSPERICAALVVYWEKPSLAGDIEVVIVNQDLGF
ncbi:MAG: LUD domain-containing protein [Oscillospiraceae bacterium]|nr:LUD domain-containing protein [Oscillospiraceae bacterium]